MEDFSKTAVREWSDVSFYHNSKKQWIYGKLQVTINHIKFISKSQDFEIFKNYEEIKSSRKKFTLFFYTALVFEMMSGEQLWFSSLPSKNDVFVLVEYFHKQYMCKSTKKTRSTGSSEKSVMGQKLLSVTIDSHDTLAKANEKLVQQGAQLDSSIATMMDIHNDLDIASKFASDLEAWLGRWIMPEENIYLEPLLVNLEDIPEISEYEILYTELLPDKYCSQMLGILRISDKGILIMTSKQKIVQEYRWRDMSRVKVISPCEVVIIKHRIGKPDLSYGIICAQLLSFIKLIDQTLKSSVEYLTDDICTPSHNGHKTRQDKDCSILNQKEELFYTSSKPTKQELQNDINGGNVLGNLSQSQALMTKDVVTEAEIDELNKTLQDMKSMMLGVSEQLDSDAEKINKLTLEVDSANSKFKANQKRIKKLT